MEQCEIGQNLFEKFVKDRIQSGEINLWSPMKKRKLQTWKTMGKKINSRCLVTARFWSYKETETYLHA